jgi:peptidoglycan hydrolase-like protein with peptidoglycan-binding domain
VIVPSAPGDDHVEIETVAKPALYDGNEHAEVKAVQVKLDELGYPEVGVPDGRWGTRTRAAILAFRADNGMPLEALIDDKLMAALMIATPRYVNPARANATLADLRKDGAEDVKAADNTDLAAYGTVGVGALGAAGKAAEEFEGYGGIVKKIADTVQPVQQFVTDNFWLLALGVGGFIIWQTGVLKRIRLTKHQTGNDVSK